VKTNAWTLPFFSLGIGLSLLFSGCTQKMAKSGHLRPLGGDVPMDLRHREPPEGTVAQKNGLRDVVFSQVRPASLDMRVLERGRSQYQIFCSPCHGMGGYGDGIIVQRGFLAPPSYHIDRLRQAPDQHFFDVITNGYGAMYSYQDRVPESDRWAIIGYIRALQLSQNARISDLPAEDQKRISGP
jgi:mono/diheme cytochrome c family protein